MQPQDVKGVLLVWMGSNGWFPAVAASEPSKRLKQSTCFWGALQEAAATPAHAVATDGEAPIVFDFGSCDAFDLDNAQGPWGLGALGQGVPPIQKRGPHIAKGGLNQKWGVWGREFSVFSFRVRTNIGGGLGRRGASLGKV